MREQLITISKTSSKQTRRSLTIERSLFFLHSPSQLDANLHRVKDLGGEVAVGSNSALEDDFLGQNCGGEQFNAFGESAVHAKKDSSDA